MRGCASFFRASIVVLIGLLTACASGTNSSSQAASASCAEAIYTTPANAPINAVQAVQIGSAVFNSLANLTGASGIDRPSKRLPFYTVKSPLTILASPQRGVIITVVGDETNAALVYNRQWLQRLAAWHQSFAQVPRSVRLPLCRDAQTKLPLNTQYAGGFLLRRLGCITIEVQVIGESRARQRMVPLGVPRC